MSDGRTLRRRDLIKAGGVGLFGLAIGGCASRAGLRSPAIGHPPLEPVDATHARIIRTTVGLRPFRPSGFNVTADTLGRKTLIHNYGHGGAGHSLAWGTGYLAAELAVLREQRRVAVIGCGTVGLTAARQLQRRGFRVTIYTEHVPPDTTSNLAFAGFTPTSGLIDADRRNAAWDRQFQRAAEVSYRELQLLVGRGYGISWIPTYAFANEPPTTRSSLGPFPLPPQTGSAVLGPGQHPFPSTYATQRPTIRIEPSVYLDALVRDVLTFGGRIVFRRFNAVAELASLHEPIIVNCTGLGSRDLFGDHDLVPVKGQLTFLVPQPGVTYSTRGGVPGTSTGGFLHMMPRSDGIALGGTAERGVWDLTPNEDARDRIVRAHVQLFSQMTTVGSGPVSSVTTVPPEPPALESFFALQS